MLDLEMPSSAAKRARKAQQEQRLTRSVKNAGAGSAATIKLPKQPVTRMEQADDAEELCTGAEPSDDPVLAGDHAAITRPILKAINANKAELMGWIDHLFLECTLIWHDLDKTWGRLTSVEDRIFEVENTLHTYRMAHTYRNYEIR